MMDKLMSTTRRFDLQKYGRILEVTYDVDPTGMMGEVVDSREVVEVTGRVVEKPTADRDAEVSKTITS